MADYTPNTLLAVEGKEDDPDLSIRFQLMTPEIVEAHTVAWNDLPIVGRSEPLKLYAGGSARSFTFELQFAGSVEDGDGWTPELAYKKVKLLQSFTYPIETGFFGLTTHPPVLTLIVGRTVSTRVVAMNVEVRWAGPWILSDDNGGVDLPIVTTVRLRLEEVNLVPLSMQDFLIYKNPLATL